MTAVHHAPGDYPGGKEGDVLTVEFTVLGRGLLVGVSSSSVAGGSGRDGLADSTRRTTMRRPEASALPGTIDNRPTALGRGRRVF